MGAKESDGTAPPPSVPFLVEKESDGTAPPPSVPFDSTTVEESDPDGNKSPYKEKPPSRKGPHSLVEKGDLSPQESDSTAPPPSVPFDKESEGTAPPPSVPFLKI